MRLHSLSYWVSSHFLLKRFILSISQKPHLKSTRNWCEDKRKNLLIKYLSINLLSFRNTSSKQGDVKSKYCTERKLSLIGKKKKKEENLNWDCAACCPLLDGSPQSSSFTESFLQLKHKHTTYRALRFSWFITQLRY